jgi:4-hydroxy-tetrahydrodipicolinate synthase
MDPETLDHAGLERLVEHVLAGGVHGLFVLGTTGEGPSLSYKLRCEVVERTCQLVAGRAPVLVGATDTSLAESVNLAGVAADAGAAAVVLAAPPYYPLTDAELWRYVRRAAAAMPLPLFLYNMPSHTKLAFAPRVIERAVDVPRIVGLKDSSGSMHYFHRIHRLRARLPDWTLLVGPEEMLAESVLFGGDGGVNGGANFAPRLYVDLFEAAQARDLDRVRLLHDRVIAISRAVYTIGRSPSSVIQGIKAALAVLGICGDSMADPLRPLRRGNREPIRQAMRELVEIPR